MSDPKPMLAKFIVADSFGQKSIAINPEYVRYINATTENIVAIDLGGTERVRVEGDLECVAKSLGFRLGVTTMHTRRNGKEAPPSRPPALLS